MVLKNYLASDVHQYGFTLFLSVNSEILWCVFLFFKKKKKEICKIYLSLSSLFILKGMFHAFAKGVCVGLFVFFCIFFPLLSKFHLCFPSRICEKYFQYISLNGFLVLILLPRHVLLTAFGNRILDWMDLGLTQCSCFYFLKCWIICQKKWFLFICLCAAAVALEKGGVCGLLLRVWRQIQRCTTAHLSNYRSVSDSNLLLNAEAIKRATCRKSGCLRRRRVETPRAGKEGTYPSLPSGAEKRDVRRK